jgi:hypothetical protein
LQAIHDQDFAGGARQKWFEQLAGGTGIIGYPRTKMIREGAAPREGVAMRRAGFANHRRKFRRFTVERFEQDATVCAKNFSVGFANGIPTFVGQ